MAKSRRLFAVVWGLFLSLFLTVQINMTVQAGGSDNLEDLRGGVAAMLNPDVTNSTEIANAKARELNLNLWEKEDEEPITNLVMANVKNALNVRSDVGETADKVGKLYKDCGGTILDRRDGWTKLQ